MNESGLHGQNYSTSIWKESEVLEYLRQASISGQIISNVRAATYIFVGEPAMHWSLSTDIEGLQQQIKSADDGSYIAYFSDWYANRYFTYNVFDMARLLQPVANLRDGFVFKVNRAYSANPTSLLRTPNGEPVLRSVYDLYLGDRKLIYVKEPCSVQDIEARFFLHIYPIDTSDLSGSLKQHGFENLDFHFSDYGERHNDRCQAERWLPEYDISNLVTGQFISGQGRIWIDEIHIEKNPIR